MDTDHYQGMGRQLFGALKEFWGVIMDDTRMQAAGTRERAAGRAQARRGASRQQADRDLAAFRRSHRQWADPSRGQAAHRQQGVEHRSSACTVTGIDQHR